MTAASKPTADTVEIKPGDFALVDRSTAMREAWAIVRVETILPGPPVSYLTSGIMGDAGGVGLRPADLFAVSSNLDAILTLRRDCLAATEAAQDMIARMRAGLLKIQDSILETRASMKPKERLEEPKRGRA